jgi:putative transposase
MEKRELVDYAKESLGASMRIACRALCLSRTVYRYHPDPTKDDPVIEVLLALADQYPRYGFGKMFPIIRRRGYGWNHKRVHRIYCELNLNMRRKGKKRLPNRNPDPLSVPGSINQCWSADFMSDALWCGRRFRTFNLVDDYNREVLTIEVARSLTADRVVIALDRVATWRGYPQKLRLDNGPELTSIRLAGWAEQHGVTLEFIKPGRPMQNGFIERFNRTYRTEVLDMFVFKQLKEVQEITESWVTEYNEERPHESLGNLTPKEYLAVNQ